MKNNNIKCKNCNGDGGWDIAIPCNANDTMWISDGECMELGYKECFWCKGTGQISKDKIMEVKELKKVGK